MAHHLRVKRHFSRHTINTIIDEPIPQSKKSPKTINWWGLFWGATNIFMWFFVYRGFSLFWWPQKKLFSRKKKIIENKKTSSVCCVPFVKTLAEAAAICQKKISFLFWLKNLPNFFIRFFFIQLFGELLLNLL